MCQYVGLEMAVLVKSPMTDVALVWSIARVSLSVYLEIAGPHERLAADVADIRTFARVCVLVLGQVALVREGLVADVTLMWFHARVCNHVFTQMTAFSECLLTHITSVWLQIDLNVCFKVIDLLHIDNLVCVSKHSKLRII